MKTTIAALAAAALAVGASFVVSAQVGPAVDPAQDAAWHNRQSAALAQLQPADGWLTLPGGLRMRRVAGDGSGAHPTINDVVTLNYEGRLIDGTVFDSSYARGRPATFPLGGLIPAWRMAVPHMGVGDTAEIAVPSDLAYGTRGAGPIPGGATLLFKMELLGIEGQ